MFLIKQKGLLHECNSTAAQYLFQQDKFYDVSYDTGDKSIQCGRKIDVLKFWLMLKARGLDGFERLIDNSFEMTHYFVETLSHRPGFLLTQTQDFHFTNVCFWFVPRNLRGKDRTDNWWNDIYALTANIKEMMIKDGSMMITYCPLPNKSLGNFFRMALACFPPATKQSIDFIVNEIERLGETAYSK